MENIDPYVIQCHDLMSVEEIVYGIGMNRLIVIVKEFHTGR